MTSRALIAFHGPSRLLACMIWDDCDNRMPKTAHKLEVSWKNEVLTVTGPNLPVPHIDIHYIEAFCRPASHERFWSKTVIPHRTNLLSRHNAGARPELQSTLEDVGEGRAVWLSRELPCVSISLVTEEFGPFCIEISLRPVGSTESSGRRGPVGESQALQAAVAEHAGRYGPGTAIPGKDTGEGRLAADEESQGDSSARCR